MTFETCDQSDEGTWPDQQKDNDQYKYMDNDNDKDKYIWRAPSKSNPRDLLPLRYLIREMSIYDQQKYNDKDNDNDNDKHGEDMTWPTKIQ